MLMMWMMMDVGVVAGGLDVVHSDSSPVVVVDLCWWWWLFCRLYFLG